MQRRFFFRRNFAKFVLKLVRWKTVGTVPPEGGILVGAPHTSNWDWVFSLLLTWSYNIQPRLLVKKEFMVGPLGWFMRKTGSVAIDRDNPRATVEQLLADAQNSAEPFFIALAAEGTRSKGTYWKSGFRRLAKATGLPIALAFIDAPNRTVGWGPTLYPTDDVVADMDILREFFADKVGINPDSATPPLLREEVSDSNSKTDATEPAAD